MADMIARLKLDSGEYDSKIQRARAGLLQLENECRNAGKSLNDISKENLDFVRGLGQMQTVSNSVRGKIGELTAAFTDLSSQYKHLTDEEKKGEYGQALSASLEQLKTRINDAKGEFSQLENELKNTTTESNGTGSAVDALTSKLTVNLDALKLLDLGLQAVNGALDVAKDAFMTNEQFLDMWGETVEASESLYRSFLDSLNNSDLSGFLNNIGQIIGAATAAYDALDALNTFNAFNQVNVEKARTGMTNSIVGFREGSATKDQVKAAGEAYKNELRERQRLEQEDYIAAITEVARERRVNPDDLIKALSGTYGAYQDLKKKPLTGSDIQYIPGLLPGMAGRYENVAVAANEEERLADALRQLNDTELKMLQARGAQAERTSNEISQVDRQLLRVLNPRTGGGGGSGSRVSKGAAWAPIAMGEVGGLDFATGVSGVNWGDAYTRDFRKDIKNLKLPEEEKNEKTMVGELQKITGGVQGMLSGLNQLGVEIPEGLGNVISGISGVLSVLQSINMIVGTIQTIETVGTFLGIFGNGGIVPHAAGGFTVPGNDFADRTPIMAQSGELILNRAQQGNLVSQMTGVSGGGIDVQPWVDGEKIFLGMNNTSRRMGKGEIVTTSMLRSRGLW